MSRKTIKKSKPQNKSTNLAESKIVNQKTNQESTIHLDDLELDIPLPKPPLNIEG